jgi:hypothetical protein
LEFQIINKVSHLPPLSSLAIFLFVFQTLVKNINHEYKNETAHIAELLVKLKADAPDLAERVSELQKVDKYVSYGVSCPLWNCLYLVQWEILTLKLY